MNKRLVILLIGGACLSLLWLLVSKSLPNGSFSIETEPTQSATLEQAETAGKGNSHGMSPRVALEPGIASTSDEIVLRVIDAETLERLDAVHILGISKVNTDMQVLGVTDSEGLVRVGARSHSEFLFVNRNYAIQEVSRSMLDGKPAVVRLRERPLIICNLAGVSHETAAGYEFTATTFSKNTAQLLEINRLVPSCETGKSWYWSGIGGIQISAPTYEPCNVIINARVRGRPDLLQTATSPIDSMFPINRVEPKFVPALSENRVDTTIEVLFTYPEDIEITVKCYGPRVSQDGPAIYSVKRRFDIEGQSNERINRRIEQLIPGIYTWNVTAKGRGTYDMGQFSVVAGQDSVELTNETEYVTGEIVILPTPTYVGPTTGYSLMNGFKKVTGARFRRDESMESEMVHQYVVPKNTDLWARAVVYGHDVMTRPVKIDTRSDGARAVVGEWVERCQVGFEVFGAQSFEFMCWVEIRDTVSGMTFTTPAKETSRFGPYEFPAGLYTVRACWVGGSSEIETLVRFPVNEEVVMVSR